MELGLRPNTVLYTNDKHSVVVRLAINPNTQETVVMKELTTSNPIKAKRYLDETWAHSRLRHPNICGYIGTYYTYNVKDNKYKCSIIMERQAVDMEKLIHHKKTPFQESMLRSWLLETVNALAYAQQQKMCHRDIKPKNLLLTDDAQIKIGDFGFSKFVTEVNSHQTWVGTMSYLSPKLWNQYEVWKKHGHASEKVMHNPYKSDVYSLGVSMLQASLRYVPDQGPSTHLKLVDALVEYSPEWKRVLREMLVQSEDFRKDFLSLKPFINTLFQKGPPPPESSHQSTHVESIDSSALGISIDSSSPVSPASSLLSTRLCHVCVTCGHILNDNLITIPLPCDRNHKVCSVDCLAIYVSKCGFKHVECPSCRTFIDEAFLIDVFKRHATTVCSECGSKVKAKYLVAKCHHLLCKVHFKMNSHACPICGVPYDFERLRNLSSRFRRFLSTFTIF